MQLQKGRCRRRRNQNTLNSLTYNKITTTQYLLIQDKTFVKHFNNINNMDPFYFFVQYLIFHCFMSMYITEKKFLI